MRVLVLGGRGFLGRHVASALAARGHRVAVGSRRGGHADAKGQAAPSRCVRFERLAAPRAWDEVLAGADAVVNCVGILRERGGATYERVHHLAPAALAADCARLRLRLVHVSALGLDPGARSGFIASKLRGEAAIRESGADYTIVRPSLLDGEGGFGARWLRALARFPVHCVPADADGRIAVLAVEDAGTAIGRLCELRGSEVREAELGGPEWCTLSEYMAALRALSCRRTAYVVHMPAPLARLASHLCDLVHFSPYSFGHLELLRHDNVPRVNALPWLLGGAPRRVGAPARQGWPRNSVCARSRQPSAERNPRWWKQTDRASAVNGRVRSTASSTGSGTPTS